MPLENDSKIRENAHSTKQRYPTFKLVDALVSKPVDSLTTVIDGQGWFHVGESENG